MNMRPDLLTDHGLTRPRSLTLAQLSRGAQWRLDLSHPAESTVMIWITKGQGRATIRGIRRGIGTHNLLFIPRGCLMSLWPGPQGFGQAVLLPAEAQAGLGLPGDPVHLRIRDVAAQAEFTALLEGMQREQQYARPFQDEALEAHARLMGIWMRRHMGVDDDMPARGAADRLVRAYAALIERDLLTARSVADYAEELGVTPTHLTRSCREAAGCTAANLLTQARLHAARSLLARGDIAVQDVASHMGFSSAAYFTRFIRRHTGKNPSALRGAEEATGPASARPRRVAPLR